MKYHFRNVLGTKIMKGDGIAAEAEQVPEGEKRFDVPNPPTWDYRLKQRGGSTYLIPQLVKPSRRKRAAPCVTGQGMLVTPQASSRATRFP